MANRLRTLRSANRDVQRNGSTRRDRKPMSSHPDAEPPLAKLLVTEADIQDYRREAARRKPIVSINGEDVEIDPKFRRAA